MIERVTITGADNSVHPKELVGLSTVYPFVEWGILLPQSEATGLYRFPTKQWILDLLHLCTELDGGDVYSSIKLSAHICPPYSTDIIQTGDIDNVLEDLDIDLSSFGRIQLNVHGIPLSSYCSQFVDWCKNSPQEIILQADGVNDWIARGIPNTSVLYDTSSGAGIFPDQWPNHTQSEKFFGYAGGLNIDTLPSAIQEWTNKGISKPFWIDLETGVRREGLFIVSKTQEILDYTSSDIG